MTSNPNIYYDSDHTVLAKANVSSGTLPEDYIARSIEVIRASAKLVMYPLGVYENNRDLNHIGEFLPTVVADGERLMLGLPWFEEYYHGELREIASESIGEEAICLKSPNEKIIGLVFGPNMRIEAHTDIWAINTNLYLKSAKLPVEAAPTYKRGTIIGQKNAKSNKEILDNPMAVVASGVGFLTVQACSNWPHTIGVPDSPDNFVIPDIENDNFWLHSETRISLNMSYSTERQLSEKPKLRPLTDRVGFSKPVLGKLPKG